jgi:DNA-binding IclR family transcriptional regulator
MPAPVRQILDQLLGEFTTIGYLSDDDPARAKQPVATIAAPVFDHRQRVALIVAVHPLCALTRRQVLSIGKRLVDETRAISKAQREPK